MATRKSAVKTSTQLAWRYEPLSKPLLYKESDAKYIGDEPTYPSIEEQDKWTHSEYTQVVIRSLNWYHKTQDAKASVNWASQFISRNPKREDLASKVKAGDINLGPTIGYAFRAARTGLKLRFQTLRSIVRTIKKAEMPNDGSSISPKANKSAEPLKTVPNIQERMAEKTAEFLGELEGRFDDFMSEFKGDPKLVELMTQMNVPAVQVKTVQEFINKKIAYFQEVSTSKDTQVLEAYKFLGKRQLTAIIKWWTQALTDANSYNVVKKASKAPRKKKAVLPEKVVSKMKYLKEFKELGLTSVAPTSILTAAELWVYNTKTRKLGVYIVDQYAGTLGVKGTAITGYDEAASLQKTLRKPAEQLKEWAKNGKPAAKKWFKGIKSVETKLNGRINADMILLKSHK